MEIKNVELLKFAYNFTDKSKQILKKNYFKKFRIEEKSDGSLVTNIDKEIETRFRELLKKNTLTMELLEKSLEKIKIKVNIPG